jgi:hypothetical protein
MTCVPEDVCELLCLDLPRAEAIRQRLDPGLAGEIVSGTRTAICPARTRGRLRSRKDCCAASPIPDGCVG